MRLVVVIDPISFARCSASSPLAAYGTALIWGHNARMEADGIPATPPDTDSRIAHLEAQHTVDQGTIADLEAVGIVDRALIATLEADGVIDRNKIANLDLALASCRRIGAALGIVMATQKLTEEQAFEVLRAVSQSTNRKLHSVAEDVLHTGTFR